MGCLTLEEQEQYATENINLIHYIANKYRSTGLEYEDLFSSAMLGFTKALKSYENTKGAKFVTYATRCAVNEILMYLKKSKKAPETVSVDREIETDKGSTITILDMIANPEKEVDWKDINPIIQRVVSKLKGNRKTIFLLFLEGNRQVEITKMLNISRTYVGLVVRETLKLVHEEYWREEEMAGNKMLAEKKTNNQEYELLMDKLKEELQIANKEKGELEEKLRTKITEYEEVIRLKDEQNYQLVKVNQKAVAQVEKLKIENRNLHAAADDTEKEVAATREKIQTEESYMMEIEKLKKDVHFLNEENKIVSKANTDLQYHVNDYKGKFETAIEFIKVLL